MSKLPIDLILQRSSGKYLNMWQDKLLSHKFYEYLFCCREINVILIHSFLPVVGHYYYYYRHLHHHHNCLLYTGKVETSECSLMGFLSHRVKSIELQTEQVVLYAETLTDQQTPFVLVALSSISADAELQLNDKGMAYSKQ